MFHTTNAWVRCFNPAAYRLRGGTLSVRDLKLGVGSSLLQYGGTHVITGGLTFGHPVDPIGYSGGYRLADGVLIVSNLSNSGRGGLSHEGGVLIASNIWL